jgi:threonine/homoserine/homoserine lactone efflux protein
MASGVVPEIAAYAAIVLVAVAVPGPDFAIVFRNSVRHGSRAGVATTLGISTGTLVHVTAAAAGLSVLLATSRTAFTVVKVVGAGYLVLIGLRALYAAYAHRGAAEPSSDPAEEAVRRVHTSYRQGLFTNLSNPKVVLFYIGLMPHFIIGHTHTWAWAVGFVVISALINLGWFTLMALLMTSVSGTLRRPPVARALDAGTGVLFMGLGVWLALSSSTFTASA